MNGNNLAPYLLRPSSLCLPHVAIAAHLMRRTTRLGETTRKKLIYDDACLGRDARAQ